MLLYTLWIPLCNGTVEPQAGSKNHVVPRWRCISQIFIFIFIFYFLVRDDIRTIVSCAPTSVYCKGIIVVCTEWIL